MEIDRAKQYRIIKRNIEHLVIVALIFWSTNPNLSPLIGRFLHINGLTSIDSYHPAFNTIRLSLGVSLIFLILAHWKELLSGVILERGILLLVLIAFISSIWSISPLYTLKSAFSLLLTTFIGYYLGLRFPVREQLELLGGGFAILILVSLLATAVIPEHSISSGYFQEGAWRGVLSHKNGFGMMMVYSTIIFWLLANNSKGFAIKFVLGTGFALSISLLLLSASRGAMAALLCVAIMCAVLHYLPWRGLQLRKLILSDLAPMIGLVLLTTIIIIAVLFRPGRLFLGIENQNPFQISLSGPVSTLTGRAPMWARLIQEKIANRPIFGYGYNSFWTPADFSPSRDITWASNGLWTGTAHNGYLEYLIDFGLIGVPFLILELEITLVRATNIVRAHISGFHLWPIAFLTAFLAISLVESSLMGNHYPLPWLIYTTIATSVSMRIREYCDEVG